MEVNGSFIEKTYKLHEQGLNQNKDIFDGSFSDTNGPPKIIRRGDSLEG